jgi:hypothetical protein
MTDLIDRDALKPFYESGTDPNDTYADMTFIRVEHIENAPAVNRWIPCSERLPEVYEKVLTYSDDGIIHDNFRLNLRDGSVGWSQGWGITHWQPRPEPPEKE